MHSACLKSDKPWLLVCDMRTNGPNQSAIFGSIIAITCREDVQGSCRGRPSLWWRLYLPRSLRAFLQQPPAPISPRRTTCKRVWTCDSQDRHMVQFPWTTSSKFGRTRWINDMSLFLCVLLTPCAFNCSGITTATKYRDIHERRLSHGEKHGTTCRTEEMALQSLETAT